MDVKLKYLYINTTKANSIKICCSIYYSRIEAGVTSLKHYLKKVSP